ncbi:MAG: heavy-metal-associated domain-containing protein, partial [Rhodoferax sp.]|nr:heavy-metal-associated domain-containing protein [Rhodoferax sp.]
MHHLIDVTGMTCGHCEKAVTRAVLQQDPAAQVRIERVQGLVEVDSSCPPEVLAQAIAAEGYT